MQRLDYDGRTYTSTSQKRAGNESASQTECTVERRVGKQPIWTFNRPSEQLAARDVQGVNGITKGVKKILWAAFK